jgi:drug/metabolite transporter (DMT)-like permease
MLAAVIFGHRMSIIQAVGGALVIVAVVVVQAAR